MDAPTQIYDPPKQNLQKVMNAVLGAAKAGEAIPPPAEIFRIAGAIEGSSFSHLNAKKELYMLLVKQARVNLRKAVKSRQGNNVERMGVPIGEVDVLRQVDTELREEYQRYFDELPPRV